MMRKACKWMDKYHGEAKNLIMDIIHIKKAIGHYRRYGDPSPYRIVSGPSPGAYMIADRESLLEAYDNVHNLRMELKGYAREEFHALRERIREGREEMPDFDFRERYGRSSLGMGYGRLQEGESMLDRAQAMITSQQKAKKKTTLDKAQEMITGKKK